MSNFEPQCKTQAELHREWARVLDMCEGTKVDRIDCFKYDYRQHKGCVHYFLAGEPSAYEFAVAIVEGTPVFRGDELYHLNGGKHLVQVIERHKNGKLALRCVDAPYYDGDWLENYSWNPPKPKTVMVEMLREDAEWLCDMNKNPMTYYRISDACKKALVK